MSAKRVSLSEITNSDSKRQKTRGIFDLEDVEERVDENMLPGGNEESSTSEESIQALGAVSTERSEAQQVIEMTVDMVKALGEDPDKVDGVEVFIPDVIKDRLVKGLASGLKQEVLEGLMLQYIAPEYLKVPKLNTEILLHMHEGARKRDAYLSEAQELTFMSMTTLGGLLGALMDEKIHMDVKVREHFIGLAMEASYLQVQHAYEQTQTRKAFILPTIKNEAVKQLLQDQITDEFLFGKDLPEKLTALEKVKKSAKLLTAEPVAQQKSGMSFLEKRANHPRRQNKAWSGQGALSNRWTFKSKMPQLFQQNQGQRPQKNNQGKK